MELTRENTVAILGSNQWPLPCEGTRHSRKNPVFAWIFKAARPPQLTTGDHH